MLRILTNLWESSSLAKSARWAVGGLLAVTLVSSTAGCGHWGIPCGISCGEVEPMAIAQVENPAHVPIADPNFLWEHLVDVVDDYFRIAREERVRFAGDIYTEGRIDTLPLTGATQIEPWRLDSVTPQERLESTFQSIRRTAHLRVIPVEGGFLVDVQVDKELEDVIVPEKSLSSFGNLRNDDSLRRSGKDLNVSPDTLGWIPIGRDIALEQAILSKLYARIAHP